MVECASSWYLALDNLSVWKVRSLPSKTALWRVFVKAAAEGGLLQVPFASNCGSWQGSQCISDTCQAVPETALSILTRYLKVPLNLLSTPLKHSKYLYSTLKGAMSIHKYSIHKGSMQYTQRVYPYSIHKGTQSILTLHIKVNISLNSCYLTIVHYAVIYWIHLFAYTPLPHLTPPAPHISPAEDSSPVPSGSTWKQDSDPPTGSDSVRHAEYSRPPSPCFSCPLNSALWSNQHVG